MDMTTIQNGLMEEAPRRERFRRWHAAELRKAKAEALREAAEKDAITIPDILGYKVRAVAVEDLLNRADQAEEDQQERKVSIAELAAAWEDGHSWGWSDAREAHDVRQDMAREDWSLKTPNPYSADQQQHTSSRAATPVEPTEQSAEQDRARFRGETPERMRRRLNKAAAGTALLIGTADAEQQGGMMKAGPAMQYRVAPATLLHTPALAQVSNTHSAQRRLSLYLPDDDGSGPGSVVSLAIGGNSARHLPQPSDSGSGTTPALPQQLPQVEALALAER